MPVWFPFLIRKCMGVSSNFGHIRYSSNKLRSYGFDNNWDINRVTGIMVEKYYWFMKAQNVNYMIDLTRFEKSVLFIEGQSYLADEFNRSFMGA